MEWEDPVAHSNETRTGVGRTHRPESWASVCTGTPQKKPDTPAPTRLAHSGRGVAPRSPLSRAAWRTLAQLGIHRACEPEFHV